VVRAAIADPARTRGVRRLLYSDDDAGEAPTLTEVPRRWVALDFDGLELPPGVDPRDLAACGRRAMASLPRECHGASALVQATAGHGIKAGARLRLWLWLLRRVAAGELAAWFRGSPVDPAAFRPSQPIYTAAPLFEGRADPLPQRLARLPGATDAVPVPPSALLRAVRRVPPPRLMREGRASGALDHAYRAIAAAAPGTRHSAARRMAGFLALLAREGRVLPEEAADAVRRGCAACGLPYAEGESLARWTARRAGRGA
jgi:hypothetical protein